MASLISTAKKIEATEEAPKLIDSEYPSSSFQVNCVVNEDPQLTPVNKLVKEGANIPKKTKERRISRTISNLPRVPTKLCVALAVAEATATEAQTAQLNAFAMLEGKRAIFPLSALK